MGGDFILMQDHSEASILNNRKGRKETGNHTKPPTHRPNGSRERASFAGSTLR